MSSVFSTATDYIYECLSARVRECGGAGVGDDADWYCVTEIYHTASPHMLPSHHTDATLFVIVIFDK